MREKFDREAAQMMGTPEFFALSIFKAHTEGYMAGATFETEDKEELFEMMASETTAILVERLLDGNFDILLFNKIRDCLAVLLWEIFKFE